MGVLTKVKFCNFKISSHDIKGRNKQNIFFVEYDAKRQQLLQSYEELQRENHNLRQKRDHLDKDMAVYNERRMRIAERRRHMHLSLEGIHHSLRTLSNL